MPIIAEFANCPVRSIILTPNHRRQCANGCISFQRYSFVHLRVTVIEGDGIPAGLLRILRRGRNGRGDRRIGGDLGLPVEPADKVKARPCLGGGHFFTAYRFAGLDVQLFDQRAVVILEHDLREGSRGHVVDGLRRAEPRVVDFRHRGQRAKLQHHDQGENQGEKPLHMRTSK